MEFNVSSFLAFSRSARSHTHEHTHTKQHIETRALIITERADTFVASTTYFINFVCHEKVCNRLHASHTYSVFFFVVVNLEYLYQKFSHLAHSQNVIDQNMPTQALSILISCWSGERINRMNEWMKKKHTNKQCSWKIWVKLENKKKLEKRSNSESPSILTQNEIVFFL